MEHVVAAAMSVVVMLSLLAFAPMAPAAAHTATGGPNLVDNPSVEVAESATEPVSWSTNSWGATTATFTYVDSGFDGARSVRTDITSWSDGDAKWYFDPVAVTPLTEYAFHDHYRSDVTTSLVARFTLDDGAFVYEWLGDVAPSSDWAVASGTFTAPPDAIAVTVFHVIAAVGSLTIDDVYLGEHEPEPDPPSSSLVPNDSVEAAAANDPAVPAKWFTNSWGSNSASFEYVDGDAHTGSRSVKTTVTNYASGDAKWWFDPVPITAGAEYTFTDHYKSSVSTAVYAVFYDAANVPSYVQLEASVPPSPDAWQSITRTFTAPAGSTKLTIFHVVDGNGWLQIDDLTVGEAAPPPPPPTDGNLITNPSLESGSTAPQAWRTNSWGQNVATFIYETTGHTGDRSVTTLVTTYTSGDAKWYFDPVVVEPGTRYDYTHHYASDVGTEAVAEYTHEDGTKSYHYLGWLPPSSEWSLAQFSIVVPETVRSMTVFHVVASVGRLTIDDAFLGVAKDPPPTGGDDVIPNASLETDVGGHPAGWMSESWGSNSSTFEYLNEGHSGNRSVKVTVENYISGDGKWLFEPIPLPRGAQYRFSVWYRTNTVPHAVAMFTKDDGQVEYYGLPDPLPSGSTTEWQHYSDTFTMPVDAASVSVFLFVSNNGWVQTDDYSISPYSSEGFARPLVTLTFDDGHEDNVTTALPVLESYGFDSTQCYATTYIEDAPDEQAAIAGVLAFRDAGHEICSHTVTHPFLTQLSPTEVDFELSHSQSYLQSITGDAIVNFASPYGDHNEAVNAQIAQYYRSHRTVNEGFNSKDNFDIYRLRVQNMLSTTTLQEFQSWLDHAAATNTWLILVYHRVADDPGPYDTHTATFAQQMAALSASGLTVKTMQAALDEVVPQVAG